VDTDGSIHMYIPQVKLTLVSSGDGVMIMAECAPENLRRLMSQRGLTIDEVAQMSGLDQRTVKAVLDGTNRPHPKTVYQLAEGLAVSADEFFVDPSQLLYRCLDRQTNPVVAELVEESGALFQGWTSADFDELHSRVGTGGPLTMEGARAAVEAMNRNRGLHEKLSLLLESSQADLIRGIVEMMYEKVVAR
jgi:transcriptional regulator with XRE-family HTH domain